MQKRRDGRSWESSFSKMAFGLLNYLYGVCRIVILILSQNAYYAICAKILLKKSCLWKTRWSDVSRKNHKEFALISTLIESEVPGGSLALNLNIATFCFQSSIVSCIREHSYKTLIQGNFFLIPAAEEASASFSHLLLHFTYLDNFLSSARVEATVHQRSPNLFLLASSLSDGMV